MPLTEQITIDLQDLQEIMDMLAAKQFFNGPVIIRYEGDKIIVRDILEAHILTIDKTIYKDG